MKRRENWVDTAKAVGIILVIFYHSLPEGMIKYFIALCHLPLFAFLSGYVFNCKYTDGMGSLVRFYGKRIKSIYLPFVGYTTVFMVFHNLLCRIHFIGEISGYAPYTKLSDYIRQMISIITLGGGDRLQAHCGI